MFVVSEISQKIPQSRRVRENIPEGSVLFGDTHGIFRAKNHLDYSRFKQYIILQYDSEYLVMRMHAPRGKN